MCYSPFPEPIRATVRGGLAFWLILVLAYGGSGAASTVVMVGERLRNAITGLRTSPVP